MSGFLLGVGAALLVTAFFIALGLARSSALSESEAREMQADLEERARDRGALDYAQRNGRVS